MVPQGSVPPKIICLETSLVAPWLRLYLPKHEMQVRSLVRELGSHMPRSKKKKKKNIKHKQYCNKFNKDFKKWSTSNKKSF